MTTTPAGAEGTVAWSWQGTDVMLGWSRRGDGPKALLLPALSSISTRREMAALQARLADRFQTISIDWPGFGELPRPAADWTPEAMAAFLAFVLEEVVPRPALIVAAGHAAGYVVRHAAANPGCAGRLVLLAPTWRGPLPTMMKGRKPWFATARRWVDRPLVGPLLYRLNVNRLVVRLMAAGHVYRDKAWLSGERLREKRAVIESPGARFGSVRFVTGGLDLYTARDGFLADAGATGLPTLVVFGADTPPRSKAEIESLRGVEGVEVVELPQGKLSLHEEFPEPVHAAIAERL